MTKRRPAVAGRFYPDDKEELIELIENIRAKEKDEIKFDLKEKEIIGAVLPHAGYMYSAYQAIHYFEILKASDIDFDTFVIINPNHTGRGAEIALDENDIWTTPLGDIELDNELATYLSFSKSKEAHIFEHAGEVMVPFIQYFFGEEKKILPITLSLQNTTNAKKIAEELFNTTNISNKKIQIIASSDFSHYVEPEFGVLQDNLLLKAISNFRIEDVYNAVKKYKITACGYGAIMTLMHYSLKIKDKPQIEILKRGHSGEISPSDEVVDYISILFY